MGHRLVNCSATCMMKEEDETRFYELLEVFRKTLKVYGQDKLLDYFEKNYFTPDKIPKWAKWFRLKMFNCEWKLNNNMHVESWHNILKTHVMGRMKNIRIDKLLLILVKCEVLYFWKWSRGRLGCHIKSDPAWAVMHGHVQAIRTDTANVLPTVVDVQKIPPKRKSYMDQMCERVDTVKKLLRTRIVSLDRQKVCGGGVGGRIGKNVLSKPVSGRYISNVHSKIHSPLLQTIMAQLTAVITILRNESELRPDVITQPEFVRVENNGGKIQSVML